MSIASEIQRIKNNIANAYTSCEEKGATLPSVQNSNNLAECIASITGGSDVKFYMEDYVITSNVDSITITHNLNTTDILLAAIWSTDDTYVSSTNDTRVKVFIPKPNVVVSATTIFDAYNPSVYTARTTGYVAGAMTSNSAFVDTIDDENHITFIKYTASSKFYPGNYKVLVVAK